MAGCSGGGAHHSVVPPAGGSAGSSAAVGARKTLTINGAQYQQVCAPPGAGRAACAAVVPLGSAARRVGRSPQGVRRISSLPADTVPNFGWWPTDIISAYGLPYDPAAGGGMTVAIVDAFDSPTVEADLAVYRAFFGLQPCTTQNGCFTKLNGRGQHRNYPPPSPPDSQWSLEEALDVDAVSASCPNCKIVLVEANSDLFSDLAAAANTAAASGAQVISNSYYGPEIDPAPNPGDPPMTAFAPAYQHPGIVVTAATGDSGFDELQAGPPGGAPFPAGVPTVVAVGGTTLLGFSDTSARGWDEIGWSGSGGGCSVLFDKPAWQPALGCKHRLSSDVAATADGLAVYDSVDIPAGGWGLVGGTSASTPIIAGIFALAGNPSAMTGSASIYAHPHDLNDITSGPATGTCRPAMFCTPGAGYDGPTGMGSPAGTRGFGGTPQQWRALAKNAVEVAVNDTTLWVAQDDGRVLSYAFGAWSTVNVPGRPVRLAISPSGTPYAITGEGKLWTDDPSNGWTSLGCCYADVAAGSAIPFPGAADDLWVVTAAGGIVENDGTGWAARPGSAQRIAASADGGIWIVDRRGNASQWTGSGWTVTGCCFSDIGAADGNLAYAVGAERESVWSFNGSWSRVRARGSAIAVTPGRATPFAVDDDESVQYFN